MRLHGAANKDDVTPQLGPQLPTGTPCVITIHYPTNRRRNLVVTRQHCQSPSKSL